MPIYEYQCSSCKHQFESIQKFSDAPLVDCPGCHKPDLKKLLSVPAFRLTGSGWYETDFKTGSKKNIAGGSSSGSDSNSSDGSNSSSTSTADSGSSTASSTTGTSTNTSSAS